MPDRSDTLLDLPILDELGHELDRAFRAADAAAPVATRRWSWTRPRTRWSAAAALGATAAVAAGLVLGSGVDGGRVAPAPATAAAVLDRAADAAEQRPLPFPGPDQFYVVESVDMYGSTTVARDGSASTSYETTRRRSWTSERRTGRLRTQRLDRTAAGAAPTPLTTVPPARAGRWETLPLDPDRRFRIGGLALDRRQLRDFPTDPRTVYQRLRKANGGAGRSRDGEVFVTIGDALRATPLPAAVRATLYRTLALVPGIHLSGTLRDRLGRPALAVSYQEPGTWSEHLLLLDPTSYALLGEREVVAPEIGPRPAGVAQATTTENGATVPVRDEPRPSLPAGTITGESVVVRAGVADRIGELPSLSRR